MTPITTAAEHFSRFEVKYLLHHSQAREFLRRIAPHVRGDRHGREGAGYKVLSLYYDSPGLACYWEKLDGEKYRRKVRVRTYGDRPDTAFVEIKQRLNLNVKKRRLSGPLDEVQSVMADICAGRYPAGLHPVYDEVCHLFSRYRLRPTLLVGYQREAYFDGYQRDLRITLDRNVRCRNIDLDLRHLRARGRFAIPPQYCILEVKFNDRVPRWLTIVLNSLGFQVERISKYCAGVEQTGLRRLVGD